MADKYTYTIGRRKSTVATVRLYEAKGDNMINGKKLEEVLTTKLEKQSVLQPFNVLQLNPADYYFTARVVGGGITGRVDAIKLALSRALIKLNPDQKKLLKDIGFLTRDSREVERKKTGFRKARKKEQYSKR